MFKLGSWISIFLHAGGCSWDKHNLWCLCFIVESFIIYFQHEAALWLNEMLESIITTKPFLAITPSWMNFKIIFNKGRSKIYIQSWSVIQPGDVSHFGRHCWRLEEMEAGAEVWMVHAALKSARLWVNIICAPPQPARHQFKSNLYYVHTPTSSQISSFDTGGVQRSSFFSSSKKLTFSFRRSRNCFL